MKRRICSRVGSMVLFSLLLFGAGAFADSPPAYTCSCDVNDSIDANGFIRGPVNQARGNQPWKVGEQVIIQNGSYWRTYVYTTSGLFMPTIAGGEGNYSTEQANGLFGVSNGAGAAPYGDYLLMRAFADFTFPPNSTIVINNESGPGGPRGVVECTPACW